MNILITGANGFIGSHLVREALERGHTVWAGVRASSNRSALSDPRIRFVDLNYSDPIALYFQVEAHFVKHGAWDYVIHNAGLTKTNDSKQFFIVNALYTHNLIQAIRQSSMPCQKFLLMSSLSSIGQGDEFGFTPIAPEDLQRPTTEYGRSKLAAENYLRLQKDLPYVILRPTGVYGPGEQDYLLQLKTIKQGWDFAVGRTPQRITFIYVKDLVRVALDAVADASLRRAEYVVSDGDSYTDEEFSELVRRLIDAPLRLRARVPLALVYIVCVVAEFAARFSGKASTLNRDKYKILRQRNWLCDISALQRDLGFEARYNLERGLQEVIAYEREQGGL